MSAVVEGTTIPSSETEALRRSYLERLAGQEGSDGHDEDRDRTKEIDRFVLLYQIKHALLRHLAQEMKVPVGGGETSNSSGPLGEGAPDLSPQDNLLAAEAGRISKQIAERLFPDVSVPEATLRQEYDRRAAAYDHAWRVSIKTASFSSSDLAHRVESRMRQGETFDEAVLAIGATGAGRLDLTPFSPFPQPVLDAVAEAQPGEIRTVEVESGHWASCVVERREDRIQLSFDDVRADLSRELVEQERLALFSGWFDKKLREAKISVERRYGTWDAEGGVVR